MRYKDPKSAAVRRLRGYTTLAVVLFVATASPPVLADLIVGPIGGAYSGSIDLGCGDLVIDGTFDASGATLSNVGSVTINSGGSLIGSSTTSLQIRNWINNAGPSAFNGGGSTVTMATVCGSGGSIVGSTTFNNFSALGPNTLNFSAGEQIVTGAVILNNVTLVSTSETSYLTLQQGGSQTMEGPIGVDGVSAANGQRLAPNLTNATPSSRATNWFNNTPPASNAKPIPTNSFAGLILLTLILGASPYVRRRLNTSLRAPH